MMFHSDCRVCHGELKDVFFLGNHPLPDFSKKKPEWEYSPLAVVQCANCGLVQLRHTVDRNKLFTNYWYKSGMSEVMKEELAGLADIVSQFMPEQDACVIDIGANDGTFLDFVEVNNPGSTQIGVEPSNIIHLGVSRPNKFMQHGFFSAETLAQVTDLPVADVVTTIAMFYSVENPLEFTQNVLKTLVPGGVWINQMNDLESLVINNTFDIIGHEHTCVWSLTAFQNMLDIIGGYEVFKVEETPINGGSMRLYISQKNEYMHHSSVHQKMEREATINMATYGKQVERVSDELHKLVRRLKQDGAIIYGYGASTRGVTILNAASLDETMISGIADRDETKVGKLFPGTRIPIVSERDMRIKEPDYLLALPFSYIKQFIERERSWMDNGGKFILPLPKPRIL